MLYSNTGVSGSVTGVGSDRQLVLYYWLIPNRNTKDGIIIDISWVRGSGVNGLECRSDGWIILGGAVCCEALVRCMWTGFLFPACGGVVPTAV